MPQKLRRALTAVLMCLMLLSMLPVSAMAETYEAKVYTSRMNVYSSTSTSSRYYLGYLKKGTIFTVHAIKGEWAKVSYKGKRGFAQFKDIIMRKRLLRYTKNAAPVYKSASSSSKKLMTLPIGTEVYLVGKDGSYWLAQNKSGTMTAYIHEKYVTSKKPTVKPTPTPTPVPDEDDGEDVSWGKPAATPKPSATADATPTPTPKPTYASKADQVIALAQEQLGKPYKEKCNPPDSFDCAFLVYYCYESVGVDVKSSAESIGYDSSMDKISKISDLVRGDIVCFDTNSSDSDLSDHVGIYIGNSKFIHASSSAEKVIVSDLSDPDGYYVRTFSWGRRPF